MPSVENHLESRGLGRGQTIIISNCVCVSDSTIGHFVGCTVTSTAVSQTAAEETAPLLWRLLSFTPNFVVAVPQFKRLVASSSPRRFGFEPRNSPRGICGGQSCTGTGFPPSPWLFPCQYHSNIAPNSLVYHLWDGHWARQTHNSGQTLSDSSINIKRQYNAVAFLVASSMP